MGYEEVAARKSLSQVPLKQYFIKQLKSAEKLQIKFDQINLCHKVWPAGVAFDESDPEHIIIKKVTDATVGVELTMTYNVNMNLKLN